MTEAAHRFGRAPRDRGDQSRRAERHAIQITRAKRQAATSSSVVVGCSAGTRNPVYEGGAGQDVGDQLVGPLKRRQRSLAVLSNSNTMPRAAAFEPAPW
jgi:hypothetical protein